MRLKKYILVSLLCIFAMLGLVWQFANVPFLPSRVEIMLRQQMMLERWAESLTHKAAGESLPEEPGAVLTPEESYHRSIELLSEGRQIEAEKVVADAVKNDLDHADLLFAKAVLERSRWDKYTAKLWFGLARRKGAHTYIEDAASLALRLDGRKAKEDDLDNLIRLSDAHPDDVYLLWLSAIQCREQKKGELGRQQYEKLLSKFTVGPVMLHQTYANILSEILGDHEAALKHRYIAVSLEAKGWTLQGLANTLTYLKRYQEACAVWVRTVQVSPADADYWGGWGWTLRMMGRYEEALEKHKEAYRLDPSSAYDIHNAGYCLEKLNRDKEMIEHYRKAAEMGYDRGQFALGWCYENGRGVEKDSTEALSWYRKAAGQGNADAQLALGVCYEKGQGVAKNLQEAVKWYRLAAEQGAAGAMQNLALCYDEGKGVEKDFVRAAALYKKAVETNPDDEYNLNGYAWFLATCKDESLRNYPEAVRLAELSVAKDEQNFNLDTLAVAYDRNGQFAEAVETQKRLIAWRQKKNPGKEVPAGILKRLEAFEKKAAEAGL